jgi:hypothetical protein
LKLADFADFTAGRIGWRAGAEKGARVSSGEREDRVYKPSKGTKPLKYSEHRSYI